MGGTTISKMAARAILVALIIAAADALTRKDTRPYPYKYTYVQMYLDGSCAEPTDYITLIPTTENSTCTTYASFGTDTCVASGGQSLADCRNTLSSVTSYDDGSGNSGLRWYKDLNCTVPAIQQPTDECTFLGHHLFAKVLHQAAPVPSLTKHQLMVRYQANVAPDDPKSTCTETNHYYEAYKYGSCARVMYSDAVIYTLTEIDTPSVRTMMHSYKTRDCTESASDTVIQSVGWRRDVSTQLDHMQVGCGTARECWTGKTSELNKVEAALYQHSCVNAKCRPGNVGDICNENHDCKTDICGTASDGYGCENRCVASDATLNSANPMMENCPHMMIHDMHCLDREMGLPKLT